MPGRTTGNSKLAEQVWAMGKHFVFYVDDMACFGAL